MHRRKWSNKLPYLKEKGMHSPSFIHKVLQRWQGKLMFVTFMGWNQGDGMNFLQMGWTYPQTQKSSKQRSYQVSYPCVRGFKTCVASLLKPLPKLALPCDFHSSHLFSFLDLQILLFSHTWKGLQSKEKPHNIWSLHVEKEKAMCSVWRN